MDKNSVIGFILIAVIFVGFTMFQSGQARKRAELQAQLDSVARVEALARQAAEADRVDTTVADLAVQTAEALPIYKDSSLEAASHAAAQIVTLENSKIGRAHV